MPTTATSLGEKMLAPLLSLVFIAGGGWMTLEATAQTTAEVEKRVDALEIEAAKKGETDLRIKGVESRLDRLEIVVTKMADQQVQMMANQAAICQGVGVDCTR
jgi:hypothetical protein